MKKKRPGLVLVATKTSNGVLHLLSPASKPLKLKVESPSAMGGVGGASGVEWMCVSEGIIDNLIYYKNRTVCWTHKTPPPSAATNINGKLQPAPLSLIGQLLALNLGEINLETATRSISSVALPNGMPTIVTVA